MQNLYCKSKPYFFKPSCGRHVSADIFSPGSETDGIQKDLLYPFCSTPHRDYTIFLPFWNLPRPNPKSGFDGYRRDACLAKERW